MDRLRHEIQPDEHLNEGRDEVIRLQGRIRTIISKIREIEATAHAREVE